LFLDTRNNVAGNEVIEDWSDALRVIQIKTDKIAYEVYEREKPDPP
jgi:hypothetical protein